MAGWQDAPIVSEGSKGSWQDAPIVEAKPAAPTNGLPEGYSMVGEVGDGRIYQAPDGSLGYTSPGYSTTDPQAIQKLIDGASPSDVVQSGVDQERIAKHPVAARASKFLQGVPDQHQTGPHQKGLPRQSVFEWPGGLLSSTRGWYTQATRLGLGICGPHRPHRPLNSLQASHW